MVTSRDVARIAGVSQATVSRVMSAPGSVAPATLSRVQTAMRQLGYTPHAGAQLMRTNKAKTVGVVVNDLANPFYSEALDELTRFFNSAGFRVVVWNAGSGSHQDALRAISEYAVDGVVFTTATARSLELQTAVAQHRPVVLINRDVEDVDCDKVLSDNEKGGAQLADFLTEHGRTSVAFIGGDLDASTSRDRERGFYKAMESHGHQVPENLRFRGNFSHEVSAQIAQRLFDRAMPPEAVVCANDFMAFGVLDVLRNRGRTANECWVLGYDDVEMASWHSFSLTTVRQPSREMTAVGAQMLLDRLLHPAAPSQRVSFPPQLIVRGSTPLGSMRAGAKIDHIAPR
jgi:LacI family transcriptional regulator